MDAIQTLGFLIRFAGGLLIIGSLAYLRYQYQAKD